VRRCASPSSEFARFYGNRVTVDHLHPDDEPHGDTDSVPPWLVAATRTMDILTLLKYLGAIVGFGSIAFDLASKWKVASNGV